MEYRIVSQRGHVTITAVIDGEPYTITDTHPNFARIRTALESNGVTPEELKDLFDVTNAVRTRFEQVSDRVALKSGKIYFDYEEVDNRLSQHILRFYEAGLDFTPLVNFFEKVQTNPQAHSRDQLYNWLQDRDFTITQDGDFIAYKAVRRHPEHDYVSANHGSAVVNGAEHVSGPVPNPIGGVIELPRSQVVFDPAIGCAFGLHAGTWEYVTTHFRQETTLKVRINPRDVVSVPTDANDQKLRVCRYVVLEEVELPVQEPLWHQPEFPEFHFEDDDLDELADCDYCGAEGHDEEVCPVRTEDELYDEDAADDEDSEAEAEHREPSQFVVFTTLDGLGPMTLNHIAEQTGLTRHAVKNAVHRLVKRGLVEPTGDRVKFAKVYRAK